MNILMIQSAGKHPENAEYKQTCHHSLNQIDGVSATLWGPGYKVHGVDFMPNQWPGMEKWADAILFMEDYNSRWVPENSLRASKKLKVFWSMDTHMQGMQHLDYAARNRFDIFLTAVHMLGEYLRYQSPRGMVKKIQWFPNTYPRHLFERALPFDVTKEYDVGFLGNVANRGEWINDLRESVGLIHLSGLLGDRMVRGLASMSISWNRNIADDLNARTFETLGAGAFLLTNSGPGLGECFAVGEHLDTYRDLPECIEKVRYYLGHPEERERIAKAGHEHCREHHSDVARARQLVKIIEEHV